MIKENRLIIPILILVIFVAFSIRLFSVIRFESVIHEFDPWFNFRATKYLVEHGWHQFLHWFDETVWYPLGRPVGKTVYPGIMVTSATLHHFLNNVIHMPVNIRDLCVFMGPIFAGLTAMATFGFTKELKDSTAGLLAAGFIAICPGYISRSVAGSYDNEAISIFLMMATFYFWIKSIKSGSVFHALLTASSYYAMTASWGGYVFIINLIPLHVLVLLIAGRFDFNIYISYCVFYILGTISSMTVHFIAFQPVSTAEHMAAMGIFCLLQIFALNKITKDLVEDSRVFRNLSKGFISISTLLLLLLGFGFWYTGSIGSWTGRFYSLWDTTYAKKNIPIIASVSEHQPTTWASFFFDLHMLIFLMIPGLYYCFKNLTNGHVFAIVYAITTSYFAGVMVRLILTLTPIVCVLGALAISMLLDVFSFGSHSPSLSHQESNISMNIKTIMSLSTSGESKEFNQESKSNEKNQKEKYSVHSNLSKITIVSVVALMIIQYSYHCIWATQSAYSSPSIVLQVQAKNGALRIIDDFRESYEWLRQNTPKDSKILAWWDYGYQIAGMSERTTIVDNNTWNNTHIALVGLALGSTERNAYPILRDLGVNYILILNGALSGFSGDDINKFLWMIRIAEGIFPDRIKESDFLDANGDYRIDSIGATPALRNSLLYKTVYYGMSDFMGSNAMDRLRGASLSGVNPKLDTLEEVFSTSNLIVRIYRVREREEVPKSIF